MNDGKATFLLLGIENQSEIHYAMPVKNLIYDALNYGQQVNKIVASHRNPEGIEKLSRDDSFKKVDIDTVHLINECTGSNIEVPMGEEVVDMCKGLEGFVEKSVFRTLTELVQEGHLAVKDAAEKVGMTVEEFQKQMEKIKK